MQRKWNRKFTLIICIFLLGFFLVCLKGFFTKKPIDLNTEEKINHILSLRETAITKKDIELYKNCISIAYRDRKDNYETIIKKMEDNFDFFKKIELSTSNRTIYLQRSIVKLIQDYKLVAFINEDRKLIQGREKIYFKEEDGQWKIIKGL